MWFPGIFYATEKIEFKLILISVHDFLAELGRTGIFGKLQQVMQKEKESDMEFWRKLQAGASANSKTFAFTLFSFSILV